MEVDLKKQMRAIDLAVFAGQKRFSARTGFAHLYPNEEYADTIPIYENFCYALALFRQKTSESVLTAIELLNKLLPFQIPDGNFPVYLHEFPKAFDFHMGLRVGAILTYILRLFQNVLGEELKQKVEKALVRILLKQPEKPMWINRYRALTGLPLIEADPGSPAEWTEFLITAQLAGQTQFCIPYEREIGLCTLPAPQEKGEPRPHPMEWIISEGNYTPRLIQDHPHQLLCAPLFPFQYTTLQLPEPSFRLFWKGSTLHSLIGKGLIFNLPDHVEMGRGELFEALLYCDRSLETEILIEGKRGTSFRLGDTITIHTPQKTIQLQFVLTSGEGDFCGHIFPANRPSQIAKGYEAYDWQIGVRTLRRSAQGRIEVKFSEHPIDPLCSD